MSSDLKLFITFEAKRLGFTHVGFAKADLVSDAEHFNKWLKENYHADMAWMENYLEKRVDPRKLVDGCKTVVCFSTNYYNSEASDESSAKLARYALGDDYHDVLKERLKTLLATVQENFPNVSGRFFTDTAPILERYWAQQAGIGWIGKNTMLISRTHGSYTFLSELLLTAEIEPDTPHENFCGTCTNCLDGCPTSAFEKPFVLNSEKCISYQTIEQRGEISADVEKNLGNNIYGCDICQEVCPWNRFAKLTQDPRFTARESLFNKPMSYWENLTRNEYTELFRKSAAKRAKYDGIKRNIAAVIKHGKSPRENS